MGLDLDHGLQNHIKSISQPGELSNSRTQRPTLVQVPSGLRVNPEPAVKHREEVGGTVAGGTPKQGPVGRRPELLEFGHRETCHLRCVKQPRKQFTRNGLGPVLHTNSQRGHPLAALDIATDPRVLNRTARIKP